MVYNLKMQNKERFLAALHTDRNRVKNNDKKNYTVDYILETLNASTATSTETADFIDDKRELRKDITVKASSKNIIPQKTADLPQSIRNLVHEQIEIYLDRHRVHENDREQTRMFLSDTITRSQDSDEGDIYKYRLFLDQIISKNTFRLV
jgi:uncharacterized protein YoxC